MQKTVPALDEALEVLNEYSGIDEDSMAEAVAQQLEALIVRTKYIYVYWHMYIHPYIEHVQNCTILGRFKRQPALLLPKTRWSRAPAGSSQFRKVARLKPGQAEGEAGGVVVAGGGRLQKSKLLLRRRRSKRRTFPMPLPANRT